MTRIELAENDPRGRPCELPREVAAVLAGTELLDVHPEGESWRVRPVPGKVGAVRVGGLDVVVRSKARFASVLFMLGYARDPGFRPQEIAGAGDRDLWPAVAETLARLAERALGQGVLQGYVTRDEALAVVRGRIRWADQIARRPAVPLPLEITVDEYEVDIAENRILRAALRRMAGVPRLPARLRGRLRHLDGRLSGVSRLVPGEALPAWRPSRLNARYVPALRIAEIVLGGLGLTTTPSGVPVAAFVVTMATVFEDFVTVALREAFGRLGFGRTDGQYRTYLDELRRVDIRPDVVHLDVTDRPDVVLDAKYKLGDIRGAYPVADLYQVFSYCTVLGLRRGWLVYAGSRVDGAVPETHRVRNTSVDVVQWPLDVSVTPGELLEQVSRLAREAHRSDAVAGWAELAAGSVAHQ